MFKWIVILAVVAAIGYWLYKRSKAKSAATSEAPPPPPSQEPAREPTLDDKFQAAKAAAEQDLDAKRRKVDEFSDQLQSALESLKQARQRQEEKVAFGNHFAEQAKAEGITQGRKEGLERRAREQLAAAEEVQGEVEEAKVAADLAMKRYEEALNAWKSLDAEIRKEVGKAERAQKDRDLAQYKLEIGYGENVAESETMSALRTAVGTVQRDSKLVQDRAAEAEILGRPDEAPASNPAPAAPPAQ